MEKSVKNVIQEGRKMMANPKTGQRVQVWYNKKVAHQMALHGKYGKVVIRGSGKPRNHGIEIDGKQFVVPCGNLNKA